VSAAARTFHKLDTRVSKQLNDTGSLLCVFRNDLGRT
jgi:hypothetical protein